MVDSSKERRRIARALVDEIKKSAVIKPVDDEIEIWGMIVDQSIRGVQVSIPIELSPETTVKLIRANQDDAGEWENQEHMGRVCWCNLDDASSESYRIGIEFMD